MFSIRRAERAEYTDVGELTVRAYLTNGGLSTDDPYYEVLRDAAARDQDAELWVAVDADGTLLGSVAWCPAGSAYRELGGQGEGEFRTLAVAPAARGRGVGEALVRHCLSLAEAAGDVAVVISTADWMPAAHRLYRRLGFVAVPERDWSPRAGIALHAFVRPLP